MNEISLVAPCLNEEENIPVLVERFLAAASAKGISAEVVLIDDGSTDNTWLAIEKEIANRGDCVVGVRHQTNCGIPLGWISGVNASSGRFVCLIDSDLQNPPESVFDLYNRYLAGDCDIVRGVRKPVEANPRARVIMSKTLNSLLNLIFGMNSKDNKSGFLFGPREAMNTTVKHFGEYRHFQTFVGVSAHSHGFRVVEIDTPFLDRRAGVSFLTGNSRKVIFEVFKDIPQAAREYGWRFKKKKANS